MSQNPEKGRMVQKTVMWNQGDHEKNEDTYIIFISYAYVEYAVCEYYQIQLGI